MTVRSPSGSTSGPKSAESFTQRFRAAVPAPGFGGSAATKPLGGESRMGTGTGWATSCIPPPCSTWTSALWQPVAGGGVQGGLAWPKRSLPAAGVLPRSPRTRTAAQPRCQAQAGFGRRPEGVASPSCSALNKSLPCSKPPALPFGAVPAPPGPPGQQGRVQAAGQGVSAAPGLGEGGRGRPPARERVLHLPITHSPREVVMGGGCLPAAPRNGCGAAPGAGAGLCSSCQTPAPPLLAPDSSLCLN